jgi:hypothetical protein
MSFVVWCLWFTVMLLVLRISTRRLTSLPAIKLLLLPGVLVGTATRCVAALTAGARIKAVHLPWQPGEPVECEEPKVPILGRLALGLVPVTAAVTAILIARQFLVPGPWFAIPLPDMDISLAAFRSFVAGTSTVFVEAAALARQPEFHSWRIAVLLYLAASLLIFTAPDLREWRALTLFILPAVAFFAVIRYLELKTGLFTRAWYIETYYVPAAVEGLLFLLAMALLTLGAAAVIELACRAAGRGREKEAKPEPAKKRRAAVEA